MRESPNSPDNLAIRPSQPPAELKPLLKGPRPPEATDSPAAPCTSSTPSSYVQDIDGLGIAGRIWCVQSTTPLLPLLRLTWNVREAAYLLPVYLCHTQDDIVYDPTCSLQTRSKLLDSAGNEAIRQVVIELGSVGLRPESASLGH